MTEQNIQKSEQIASTIMRVLAILGLVAILALAAWLIIQGIRLIPNNNDAVSDGVSAVTSIFTNADKGSIVSFNLDSRTFTANKQAEVRWETDSKKASEVLFSYRCSKDVSLRIDTSLGEKELSCEKTYAHTGTTLTITPISQNTRFADVELRIQSGENSDTILVTVVNPQAPTYQTDTEILLGQGSEETSEDKDENEDTSESVPTPFEEVPTTPPSTPVVTQPIPYTPPTPVVRTPADLMVAIKETGSYLEVSGINTLFPISPIPSNKRAGVTFTVTNRGDLTSGAWAFIAHVPTASDKNYKYTSPIQKSLAHNGEIEFTLGFDDLPKSGTGTIKIEIVPTGADANTANNVDAVVVTFR